MFALSADIDVNIYGKFHQATGVIALFETKYEK